MTDFDDNIPPALKPVISSAVLPISSTIDRMNMTARGKSYSANHMKDDYNPFTLNNPKTSMHEYHENPPPLLKIEASTKLLSSRNIWRPLAIDVGPSNGLLMASDSSSMIRKTEPDQSDNVNLNAPQDQLKCEIIVQESKLASDHMHYVKTSHATTVDHGDRPKNLDSTKPFLRNVPDADDREEMDSGLDSPNEQPDVYEKTDSNADQHDHTTASSTPDDFCRENPAQNLQTATMAKKKPRKRRWILSRKPKVHRSSTKVLKIESEEKIGNTQKSKHNRNGSKYLSVPNLESMIHSSVFCPPANNNGNNNNNNRNLEIFNEPSSFEERNVVFSEKFLEFLCKFLPNLNQIDENTIHLIDRSMKNWSIDQVADFIRKLKLSSATRTTTAAKSPYSCTTITKQPFQWLQPTADDHLAEKFRDEQIDGEALLLLSREDLVRRLNIKLGLAMKIHYTIKCLNYKLCSKTKM